MLYFIQAGGWVMWPIIAGSIIALAIILERLWILRRRRVMPRGLTTQVWRWHQEGQLTPERIQKLHQGSPLSRILAVAVIHSKHKRDVVKEIIIETGRQVVADLEQNLNLLGTIAAIEPLLGLLGTVTGMIQTFSVISTSGIGNPLLLSGGIAEALITTAAGLIVAIPALVFHRYFNGLVDQFALEMEMQALKLIEVIQGDREKI